MDDLPPPVIRQATNREERHQEVLEHMNHAAASGDDGALNSGVGLPVRDSLASISASSSSSSEDDKGEQHSEAMAQPELEQESKQEAAEAEYEDDQFEESADHGQPQPADTAS